MKKATVRTLSLVLALLLLLPGLLIGCAAPDLGDPIDKDEQPGTKDDQSTEPPNTSPCDPPLNPTSNLETAPAYIRSGNLGDFEATTTDRKAFVAAQRNFGVELFKRLYAEEPGENTLLSPLSVILALSLTSQGAENNTRAQLSQLLWGGMDIDTANGYLADYLARLPENEYAQLKIANSVWMREGEALQVNDTYLSDVARLFAAEARRAPFDGQTVEDVNAWVSDKTDGMIDKVLEELEPETVMLLINALLFEAQWQEEYSEKQLVPDIFTSADSIAQQVTMMSSTEHRFLSDGMATGTYRHYRKSGYRFVAMLPNPGVSIDEYIASLDGEHIEKLLGSAGEYAIVHTRIPKFTQNCTYKSLQKTLAGMGLTDLFDPTAADLSGMGNYGGEPLYVSSITHQTAIEVNEIGTRAAAVTVELEAGAGMPPEQTYTLHFDRPFVYMIVDNNNVPIFIGAVTEIEP